VNAGPTSPSRATRHLRIAQGVTTAILTGAIVAALRLDNPIEKGLIAKLTSGAKLSVKESITTGWFGAAIGLIILSAILLVTAPWWSRPADRLGPDPRFSFPARGPWLIVALLAAMVLGGFMRWNFAHGSLWWDERAVLGTVFYDQSDPPQLIHKPVGWDKTFYYYYKPTNHVPFSVLSRLSLIAWQKLTGKQPHEFDEFIFRLPNYLAALASIFLIGWLLAEWGFPRAGTFAAFLLAVHPWHIRYGVDARSFSLLFLLTLLSCLWLTRALRDGSWRGFLPFGISQGVILWTFPYAVYLCVTLGIAALLVLLTRQTIWDERAIRLGRLIVGWCAGAALLFPLIGPHVPQMMAWTDVKGSAMITPYFLKELWAALSTGIPFQLPANPGYETLPDITSLAAENAVLLPVVLAAIPALCGAGLLGLWYRSTGAFAILLALALAAPLALLVGYLGTHYFYTRYVIYALAAVILAAAIGIEAASGLPGNAPSRKSMIAWGLHLILFAGFILVAWPQIKVLRTRSYSPNREVAHYLRDLAGKDPHSILAAGFNLGGDMPAVYNPALLWVENMSDLIPLTERSNRERKPLYVFYGYDAFNRWDEPDPFRFFDNPRFFELVKDFEGIEPQFYYRVFRYTGKPLSSDDAPH
jgi:4-amino-4-deoxy-L-arabinose transferase-like glycosyltransferase